MRPAGSKRISDLKEKAGHEKFFSGENYRAAVKERKVREVYIKTFGKND